MGRHFTIYPLGDAALTIEFAGGISEQVNEEVIARFEQFKRSGLPGLIETSPAYHSLTLFYDPLLTGKNSRSAGTAYEQMKNQVLSLLELPMPPFTDQKRFFKIPVCYAPAFAPDLETLAASKNIEPSKLVSLHCSKTYRVYMLGFLPGFPYMALLDEKISAPRKNQPVPVAAGSVAIAGNQTGIYPFDSPGGWQVIGRTPLKIFDQQKDEPALFSAGDHVQFYEITENEFYSNQPFDPWVSPS